MSITPRAIQDLLDELEASRQARRRAWDVLQDLRGVLTNLGNVTIEVPSRKIFEAEGAILKQALSDRLRDQRASLAQLADTARQGVKADFGSTADFGPAHQALLKASTERRFCYKVELCAAAIAERPEKKNWPGSIGFRS